MFHSIGEKLAKKKRDTGFWVLVATILGSSMAFIDGTVVNVALPSIQADLDATLTDLQWVIQAYLLFLASLILVGGSLGDRYGRKKIFGIGISLFALASAWSGLAPNVDQLIYARAIQGIGGALLTPGSLAIITAHFKDLQRRGQAIGTWSAVSAITTAVGPILGGWLIDTASWRWIFFINLPLAAIVLAVLYWQVPESYNEDASGDLDWLGALLVTLGLAGISYGLTESANLGLSHPLVLSTTLAGLFALLAFWLFEARATSPMLPLRLFSSRTFSGANILTFFLYGSLGWLTFYMPLNLIQVQGYSATQFGFAFLPFVLLLAGLSRWAGSLVGKVGAKLPLVVGPLLVAIGFFLLSLQEVGGSYWLTFFPGIVVLGLGMAVAVAPLTTAVMSSVEQRFSGTASGINNAVARTASLLTIAIFGIFASLSFNAALDSKLAGLDLPVEAQEALAAERSKLAEAHVPQNLSDAQQQTVTQAIEDAFVGSFQFTMQLSAGLALASALTAYLMIEGKEKISPPH